MYLVRYSSKGELDHYLGNSYNKDKRSWWCIVCKNYLTQVISCIEIMLGDIHKDNTPPQDGDHSEVDSSIPLNDE